jgi:hypothetical protein
MDITYKNEPCKLNQTKPPNKPRKKVVNRITAQDFLASDSPPHQRGSTVLRGQSFWNIFILFIYFFDLASEGQ